MYNDKTYGRGHPPDNWIYSDIIWSKYGAKSSLELIYVKLKDIKCFTINACSRKILTSP